MIKDFIIAPTVTFEAKGTEVVGGVLRNQVAAGDAALGTFNDDFWQNFETGTIVSVPLWKDGRDHSSSPLNSLNGAALKTPSLMQASQAGLTISGRLAGDSLRTSSGTSGKKATGPDQAPGVSEMSAVLLPSEHLLDASSAEENIRTAASTEAKDNSSAVISSADEGKSSVSDVVDRLNPSTITKVQRGQLRNIIVGGRTERSESRKYDSHHVSKSKTNPTKQTLRTLESNPPSNSNNASNLNGRPADARFPTEKVYSASSPVAVNSPANISVSANGSTIRSAEDAETVKANILQAFVFVENTTNAGSSISVGFGDGPPVGLISVAGERMSSTLVGEKPSKSIGLHDLSDGMARDMIAPNGDLPNPLPKVGKQVDDLQSNARQKPTELLPNHLNGPAEPSASKDESLRATILGPFSGIEISTSRNALHSPAMDGNVPPPEKHGSSPDARDHGTFGTESASTTPASDRLSQTRFENSLNDKSVVSAPAEPENQRFPAQSFQQSEKENSRKELANSTAEGGLGQGASTYSATSPAVAGSVPTAWQLERNPSLSVAPAVSAPQSTGAANLLPVSTTDPTIADESRMGSMATAPKHSGLVAPPSENRTANLSRPEAAAGATSTKLLEVGMESGSNGWLKVRAESDSGGAVSASLIANSGNAAEALHKDLPALTAYLKEQALMVNSLVIHRADLAGLAQDGVSTNQQDSFGRSEGKEAQQGERNRELKGGSESTQSESGYLPAEYLQSPTIENSVLRRNGWFKAIA